MSLLKYFSWKKTTGVAKEIPHEPSGSLLKEVLSSTIVAANEIVVTVLAVSKKKKEYTKLTDAQRLQSRKEGQQNWDSCRYKILQQQSTRSIAYRADCS